LTCYRNIDRSWELLAFTRGATVTIPALYIAGDRDFVVAANQLRAIVRLYLNGMIQQWYSRGDGKGVVLILDCKELGEAHAMIEELPLSAENLMDHEFIPIGPLLPIRALLGVAPQQK
jgi:hypothetical protein